jgi:two-component system cell cycle response regulator CtrA
MDMQARIDVLERENEELRETIAILRSENVHDEWMAAPELMLTAKEEEICRVLLKRSRVHREALHRLLYLQEPETELKIIDVFVCKVRKKLAPFGVVIQTIWGQGYTLAEGSREKLLALDHSRLFQEPVGGEYRNDVGRSHDKQQ